MNNGIVIFFENFKYETLSIFLSITGKSYASTEFHIVHDLCIISYEKSCNKNIFAQLAKYF